jgi:hypothetical protein
MNGLTALEASEGVYRIYSEKRDECVPESSWLVIGMGVGGFLMFAAMTLSFNINEPSLQPFSLLGALLCFIILFIPQFFTGCGIQISLRDSFGRYIVSDTYKFSKNPKQDAVKIKEMIAWYVFKAKRMTEADIAEGERSLKEIEKRRQCEARYKSITEKARKL